MNIEELIKKYELLNSDCWKLDQGGKATWIITHDAIEKIASKENIEITDIKVLNSDWDFCRLLITMRKDEKSVTTIGEALLNSNETIGKTKYGKDIKKGNCKVQYVGCMAEKRGIDRAVLKLIDAYQYGIKSEEEADDFKQPTEPKTESKPTQTDEEMVNKVFDETPNQIDYVHMALGNSLISEQDKADLNQKPETAKRKYAKFLIDRVNKQS